MINIIDEWMATQYFWFALGIVLLILEFMVPGLVLIFFGLGALVTGLVMLAFPIGGTVQVLIFTVSSVALLLALRKISKPILYGHSSDDPNRDELLGQRARVLEAIAPPELGKVEYNGVEWSASSDVPIEAGASVIIISRDNLTLVVKPLT